MAYKHALRIFETFNDNGYRLDGVVCVRRSIVGKDLAWAQSNLRKDMAEVLNCGIDDIDVVDYTSRPE